MAVAGPSLAEIPAWRVDVLFFLLLVISLALTKGDEAVVRYLTKREKHGFLKIYAAIKEELLLDGIISLILTGIQEPLERICVTTPKLDDVLPSFVDKGVELGQASHAAVASAGYGYAKEVSTSAGCGSAMEDKSEDCAYQGRRGILESAAVRRRFLLSHADYDDGPCPEGSSQLFPASALHAIHIMLFLVAVTQIVYSCVVLALCLWKITRWSKYEALAQQDPGFLSHLDSLHEGNGCTPKYRRFKQQAMQKLSAEARQDYLRHFFASGILMFASVDAEQYIIMRQIFLQQLDLDSDFDFLRFVKESMEEEFASLVKVNSYMWFILFMWIACPPETYISIIVPSLHFVLALVIGFKLSSVMLIFRHRVKQEWLDDGDGKIEISKSGAQSLEASRLQSENPLGPEDQGVNGDLVASNHVHPTNQARTKVGAVEDNVLSFSSELAHAMIDSTQEPSESINGNDTSKIRRALGVGWINRKYREASTDTSELFWGRKPEILLLLLQMVYFGMSIQLSMTLFSLWKDLPLGYLIPVFKGRAELYDLDKSMGAGTYIFVICTNIFIMLWCALIVLPEYALASTVGSHCPSSVLHYAQRNSLQPKLAKALEAVAKLNQIKKAASVAATRDYACEGASDISGSMAPSELERYEPDAEVVEGLLDDIIDAQLEANMGKDHGHSSAAKMKLMGAMYNAQLKRLQDQHLGDQSNHDHTTSTWHAAPDIARPEALSLAAVMNLFSSQGGSTEPATPKSEDGQNREGPAFDTLSRSGGSTPAHSFSAMGSSRVAQKQQLLMSIVSRQEQIRADQASTQSKSGKAPVPKAAPASFILARKSAAPTFNCSNSVNPRVKLENQPSKSIRDGSSGQDIAFVPRKSLRRTSATPRLETVPDAPALEAMTSGAFNVDEPAGPSVHHQEELKAARAPNPSADGKDSLMKTYSNRFNLARKSAGLALKNTFITTPTVTLERRSPSAVTMPITPSTLESRPSATPGSANPQQEEGV